MPLSPQRPASRLVAGSADKFLGVVFVHGMRTSSAIWDRQISFVESLGHQAHAVDLPAHGVHRDEQFRINRAFDIINAAVESLPHRRVLLVGLSLGGYTALAWAARQPERLAGVLAAACTCDPRGKPVNAYRYGAHALVHGWTTATAALRWAAPASKSPAHQRPSWNIVTDALAELAGQSFLAHLRDVRVPIWLVNGSRDHMRLEERRFLAAAEDARLVIVPRAGHDVNTHAPAAFNRVLGGALDHLAMAH